MSSFITKKGKAKLSRVCEHLVSNWLSWASVRAHTDMGQSDTSVGGFAQFAGCQMRLIVRPSAGQSFFSPVSGWKTNSQSYYWFSHTVINIASLIWQAVETSNY